MKAPRKFTFTPCKAGGHESCVGAYREPQDGTPVKCSCWCHVQGVLLPEMANEIKSKQGRLF